MPIQTSKNKVNKWKIKAIERNKIIHQHLKRISELEQSRDGWKLRYKELQNSLISVSGNCADLGLEKTVCQRS